MATTNEEDIPPKKASVGDMFGNVWEEFVSVERAVSQTVHGRAGRPLWPVLCAMGVLTCLLVDGTVATVVGALLTSFLLVWLASK